MTRSTLFRPSGRVRVKVCCIASCAEAEMALDAGADALGLVSPMPSGPGVISDEEIAIIARAIGNRATRVLLTSRRTAAAITEQLASGKPDVLQLVDAIEDEEMATLRSMHRNVALMRVVHVRSAAVLPDAQRAASTADALLLDSGDPTAAVRTLGGTGRVHDWQVSRAICESVDVPVFLAGGLHADNVAEAIRTVRPFGVDVCSGVRRDGRLDVPALTAFMVAVRTCA